MPRIKVSLSNVRVSKINAVVLDEDNAIVSERNLRRTTSTELMPKGDCCYRLRLTEKLNFEPSGPFQLELETIADVETDKSISEDQFASIKKQVSELVMGVNTLSVAFITEKMLGGPPIIIPPFLETEEVVKKD
jgi:hypothetical protein